MMSFQEFLNLKDKLQVELPASVSGMKTIRSLAKAPDLRPDKFNPPSSQIKRQIRPRMDGLMGRKFQSRTTPSKPSEFLSRSTS